MLSDNFMLRMGWTLLPCAVGAVLLIIFIALKIKKRLLKAVLVKGVLSVMFVAAAAGACVNFIGNNPIYALLVICGLLFGLLGDIWLDFKYIFPEHDGTFTRAGFAVFGIGHIFYIAALLLGFPMYRTGGYGCVIVPVLLAALISIGNIALEKPMKLKYGGMKPYVLVYGALLFSTALLAGSLSFMSGWQDTALNMMFAGGILFALSDLVLSGTYFGEGKNRPVDIIMNYVLYYGAQFTIACSIAFLNMAG